MVALRYPCGECTRKGRSAARVVVGAAAIVAVVDWDTKPLATVTLYDRSIDLGSVMTTAPVRALTVALRHSCG